MKKKKGPVRVTDLAKTAKKPPSKIKRKKDFSAEQSAYRFIEKPAPLLTAENLGNIFRKLGKEVLKLESQLKRALNKRKKKN